MRCVERAKQRKEEVRQQQSTHAREGGGEKKSRKKETRKAPKTEKIKREAHRQGVLAGER